MWCSFFGTLLTFPIILLTEDVLFPYPWAGWLAIIAQALVCQIVGQSLQAYNLKGFSSGFVAQKQREYNLFSLSDPPYHKYFYEIA